MNSFWLISYIVLWVIVIVGGLIILALSREIEHLHERFDSLLKYISHKSLESSKEGSRSE
jgi:hypothetical protein